MIRVSQPQIGERAEEYVLDALRSGWLSPDGPWHQRFASALQEALGAEVVLTNSGTSALETALLAIGAVTRKSKGQVIVPSYTVADSAMAVWKAGFTPVLCDVDPRRFCLTAETLRAAVTEETVGVMAIHLYGMMCALDVYQAARELGLFILDDACEAFGGTVGDLRLADLSDAQAYSLRGEKPLGVGTGGVVASKHEGIIGAARAMVGLNSASGVQRYHSLWKCVSYEYPELLSALGCAQLASFPDQARARWQAVSWYRAAGLHDAFIASDLPWKYPLWVDHPLVVQQRLRRRGMETSPTFTPLHHLLWPEWPAVVVQGALVRMDRCSFPNAEEVADHLLALPLHPGLSEGDVRAIASALSEVQGG